jgi:hypothetical protein
MGRPGHSGDERLAVVVPFVAHERARLLDMLAQWAELPPCGLAGGTPTRVVGHADLAFLFHRSLDADAALVRAIADGA